MSYELHYGDLVEEHLKKIAKSGNKKLLKKLKCLFEELKQHPDTGTGKPEILKSREGEMSRRINDKHRLVYQIFEEEKIVIILSCYGHYDDK